MNTVRMSFRAIQMHKACWIRSKDEKLIDEFRRRKLQRMAKDKYGRDVFMADSPFILQMAQQDFENIDFHFTSEF